MLTEVLSPSTRKTYLKPANYLKIQFVQNLHKLRMNQKITDIHIKELQIKFGAEQYTAVAVYEEADVPHQT